MTTRNPRLTDITAWAEKLSDAALACRGGRRHAYLLADRDQLYVRGTPEYGGYYRITWPCGNGCGVIRYTEQDAIGNLLYGRTIYPLDGYLSPLGPITGTGQDVVRAVLAERWRKAARSRTTDEHLPPHYRGTYTAVVDVGGGGTVTPLRKRKRAAG